MADKINVESFYSQEIQTTMTTTTTSINVDVAPAQDVGYAIVELGETNQEMIKWQAKSSLTLSSLLRGLSLTATTDTEVSGNKKTHAIDDSIEITNVHYIINDKVSNLAAETIAGLKTFTLAPISSAAAAASTELMRYGETCRLTGNQTVAGIKTFSSIPLGPASDPTTANQLCRKSYVDSRPAQRLSFTTMYVGEAITDRDALSREPLNNTDGGSDGKIGNATVNNGVYQAQSFVAGSVASTFSMTISIKKVGAPADNIYVEIQGDSGGSPDGTPVTNGTSADVAAGSITTGFTDIAFTWSSDPTLIAGTVYWLVIKRDGAASDAVYYVAEYANNNAFRSGVAKMYTSAWVYNVDADDDLVFAISGVSPVVVQSINTSTNSIRGRLGFLGFANAAASVGATVEIQTHGRMTGFTGLTPDTEYAIHTTAGEISTTQTNPVVGVAINATSLIVTRMYLLMTGTQAAELVGEGDCDLHKHDVVAGLATLTIDGGGNDDTAVVTVGTPQLVEIELSGILPNDNATYTSGNAEFISKLVFQGTTLKSQRTTIGDRDVDDATIGSGATSITRTPVSTFAAIGGTPAAHGQQITAVTIESLSSTGCTIRVSSTETGAAGAGTVTLIYKILT